MRSPFNGDDQVLLMIDNTRKTLENILAIIEKNKDKTKIGQNTLIIQYITKRAIADLISVGDTVQAECLEDALRTIREDLSGSEQADYWVSVCNHYLQKHSEQS